MTKKTGLFSGHGVQAKGLTSDYFFELDNLSGVNNIFWADTKREGKCETFNIKNVEALGFCRFERDKGITICLNCIETEQRADDYNDFITVLKSIDFHELAHGFYSIRWPIEGYKPRDGYTEQEVFRALNYLVDQRDEGFWLIDYPMTEKYFRYLVMHPKLLKGFSGKNIDTKKLSTEEAEKLRAKINKYDAGFFLLVWGRRFWLPDNYINNLRNSFTETYGEEALLAIESVIDRFLITTDFETQEDLVYEFIDILKQHEVVSGVTGEGSEDEDWGTLEVDMDTFKEMIKNGGAGSTNSGAKKIKIKIKNCPLGGEGEGEGESEDEDEGEGEGEGEGKGEDGEGEIDEHGSSGGEETGDTGAGENDTDDYGDLGENNNIPAPRHNRPRPTQADQPEQREKEANQTGDTFEEQKDAMHQEADRTAQKIRNSALQAGVNHSEAIGDPFRPSVMAMDLKRNLENVFKRARTDMGTHHIRRLKRGSLDVNRAKVAERTDDSRIFRQFKPSKIKKLRLATALVLDQSGSMNSTTTSMGVSNIQAATDITWATIAALHNFDGFSEVIGFDVHGRKMKDFIGKMEDWYLKADGGTDPGDCFTVVAKDMKIYLQQHLPCLCIVVTDGIWYGGGGEAGIKKLNNMGIWTVEFLIECSGYSIPPHGCKYTHVIHHLAECSGHIENIVHDIQIETRKKLGG